MARRRWIGLRGRRIQAQVTRSGKRMVGSGEQLPDPASGHGGGADPACGRGGVADPNGRVAMEIAAIQGWKECVEVLFPVTAPLARVADWSIDGLLQHARFMSSKPQHPVLHEDNEPDCEAEGDATFCRRDYSHALTLYTMAMEIDPDNSTLYAKRSLCFLYTGYEGEALEDATTYKDMQPDLSSCYEQEAALILVKEYGRTCEALLPGLNSDF